MGDLKGGQLSFIAGRGKDFCRGCLGDQLFSGIDLGMLPIANELTKEPNTQVEHFPLHLRICRMCGLGQVEDVATPERMFKDYRYLSSMSTTFLQHAQDFVTERIRELGSTSNGWVLEIASNDGYLLKNFLGQNVKVIGIEPAENVATISRSLGIKTISEFFTKKLAIKLLEEHGYPSLIIANNVMAHVPDLIDFVQGLSLLCGEETQISIENPSINNILNELQFDTIYHEHYSYLSATAVRSICEMNGLTLFKVDQLSIHGGSNRYWLSNSSVGKEIDPSVIRLMEIEKECGLFDPYAWKLGNGKVREVLNQFQDWLRLGQVIGKKIYGYGAAAKASTILNCIPNESNLLLGIADKSSEKQDRYMSPSCSKILSPEDLFAANPTDIVIFPWNIKVEIAEYLSKNLGTGVNLWCLIPNLHRVHTK